MLKYEVYKVPMRIRYYRHGEEHRVDGPSYLKENGFMTWEQYGQEHRDDGFAVIWGLHNTNESWIRGRKQ